MKQETMVQITTGDYKGLFSITLESADIRLEMVPEHGGKLVSILYKPKGKEWMLDSGSRAFRQPVYGSTFTDWDMSGWDECFPTINACPAGGKSSRMLPDHGELWALPWEYEIEEDAVTCMFRSPNLPYRFTRRISFPSADRVRFNYSAENTSKEELPFLWVPHPQFAITEPTQILLPEAMEDLLCVYGGHTLQAGESYPWRNHAQLSPIVTGDARKFYFQGRVTDTWSGLSGEESGNYLLFSVPTDKVPYLGVWMDEGMFNDRVTCALEPSIGYFDSLETAIANGTAQVIPAGGSFEWHLEFVTGAGDWREAVQELK
ncbi:hypothetical protein [Paenibacillus roseipurpureus]|uniref:DUF4432 domain-containing protein n=1 Tax=Paenibacillus roseopurpureus TaxID=2918901 RepID=A0AA96LKH1_9BACL|nr:hypothetical protein [Paenibacillus sp. MBLB1832]WNR42683.1 hypothetical protein MJB10_16335 [Paenibacillus sp. MBLB1832]